MLKMSSVLSLSLSLSPEKSVNSGRVAGLLLCFLAIFGFFFSSVAFANNVAVTSVSVVGWDKTAHTCQVKFDLSWENSWRDATNYDAVWVFVKYSTDSGATWHHAKLAASGTNPPGFNDGSGTSFEIVVPSDKKGAFLQRSGNGTGTVTATGVKLVWDYGADGLSDSAGTASTTKVKVIAIEMVYIPQGAFYAGDTDGGGSSWGSFEAGSSGAAFQMTSENALTLGGGGAGSLGNNNNGSTSDDFTDAISKTLPASFPKGYNAFYLMKYEMSQGQYVDFLNTLTRDQQNTRTATDVSTSSITNNFVMSNTTTAQYRNTIQCPTTNNGTSPTPVVFSTGSRNARAAGYLSWADLMAYADWAGLRPVTELEFEKAARGPEAAVAGEYAWGTTSITQCLALSGTGDSEVCTTASANCGYMYTTFTGGDAGAGPLRVGIFSTASTTTREGAGAGYYGNMELSGNMYERTVTVGNGTGRSFMGSHGDGELSSNGYATNSDWPGYSSGEVTGATGSGFRGGYWGHYAAIARTSDRRNAAYEYAYRSTGYGGRVGRTA